MFVAAVRPAYINSPVGNLAIVMMTGFDGH